MDDVSLFEMVHLYHLDQGFARSDFFHLVMFLLEGVNEMSEQFHKLTLSAHWFVYALEVRVNT